MNPENSVDPNDPSGSFSIQSQSTMDAVLTYYKNGLPKDGWVFRYSDPNFTGGVTQYWKMNDVYLSADFGYQDGQLTVQVQYDRVEPQEVAKLPQGFPMPPQAEMVKAEDTEWDFYIPQDFAAVTKFYQQVTAAGWQSIPVTSGGGAEGGCGGDCGGSGLGYKLPQGATPMPTPTLDARSETNLSFTTPDGNEIDLTIIPRQNETILEVTETLKNLASAGLPSDVPITPGQWSK